jgi:hypothetical protein
VSGSEALSHEIAFESKLCGVSTAAQKEKVFDAAKLMKGMRRFFSLVLLMIVEKTIIRFGRSSASFAKPRNFLQSFLHLPTKIATREMRLDKTPTSL